MGKLNVPVFELKFVDRRIFEEDIKDMQASTPMPSLLQGMLKRTRSISRADAKVPANQRRTDTSFATGPCADDGDSDNRGKKIEIVS